MIYITHNAVYSATDISYAARYLIRHQPLHAAYLDRDVTGKRTQECSLFANLFNSPKLM